MQPEEGSESLQERIQRLLSLDPTGLKKDKYASTNLKNDPGQCIGKKLKSGYFNPACRLQLGKTVPGLSYYHSIFNLQQVDTSGSILHVYSLGTNLERDKLRLPVGAKVVLHSHDSDQYCPWKAGCHVMLEQSQDGGIDFPVGYTKSDLPSWFISMWRDFYGWE